MQTLITAQPAHGTLAIDPRRVDPLEQMRLDDHADWELLRLVVCVAVATLALAMASTMPV